MRPIVRGVCPQDKKGQDIVYDPYKKARGPLISRIGEYCSYCEMHLDTSLAVEHLQPKKPAGVPIKSREFDWNNLLLVCTNCNSTKGDKDIDLADYVLPDRDNTFRAFVYKIGGVVEIAPLCDQLKKKAENTCQLVGLNRKPGSIDDKQDEASDRRWLNRREAWNMAERAKENLMKIDRSEMRSQIVDTVVAKGFWSVWMTVFEDHPEMRKALIAAYPGTCLACFDEDAKAIQRPGGTL